MNAWIVEFWIGVALVGILLAWFVGRAVAEPRTLDTCPERALDLMTVFSVLCFAAAGFNIVTHMFRTWVGSVVAALVLGCIFTLFVVGATVARMRGGFRNMTGW